MIMRYNWIEVVSNLQHLIFRIITVAGFMSSTKSWMLLERAEYLKPFFPEDLCHLSSLMSKWEENTLRGVLCPTCVTMITVGPVLISVVLDNQTSGSPYRGPLRCWSGMSCSSSFLLFALFQYMNVYIVTYRVHTVHGTAARRNNYGQIQRWSVCLSFSCRVLCIL